MGSHSWTDVWKLFLDVVSHESIAVQIAVILGTALVAVMALEGIRASFFPRRILEGVTLRNAAPPTLSAAPPVEEANMQASWSQVEAFGFAQPPRVTVNADHARRSSPRRMRVIGQRKPS